MCKYVCVCVLCYPTPPVNAWQLQKHSCNAVSAPPTPPARTRPLPAAAPACLCLRVFPYCPGHFRALEQAKYCGMSVPRSSPEPMTERSAGW